MSLRHVAAALLLLSPSASAADWGSFDASRINYGNGVFTTGLYTDLRAKVVASGGAIAPATSLLTPQYLSSIDVFYTSMLDVTTGALSGAEQAALVEWVRCGGTLVVSAEYSTISGNDSFLAPFGITTLPTVPGTTGNAYPTTLHPLTTNVAEVNFSAEAILVLAAGPQLLMKTAASVPFAALVEGTPEVGVGRVFAMGDHAPFTDSSGLDEQQLRKNLAQWAELTPPPPCPNATASSSHYGAGWPGTLGVPFVGLDHAPVIGEVVTMTLKTNQSNPTQALFLFGATPLSLPSALGGSLLVTPTIQVLLPIPAFGLSVVAPLACDTKLCGQSIFMQVLVVDPGASHGVAFTQGMQLTFGS